MRTLLIFRGAPGCGKSTFIHTHGLDPYVLSADNIRLQLSAPSLMVNGQLGINQVNDTAVWKILYEILETRMERGEFTVLDATNSKTSEMSRLKDIASMYRYRIFCMDMTSIPIDVVKEQNRHRCGYKVVPDVAIDKMYARFATQKIPSGIKVITPGDLDSILFKPIDLSSYDKIHHIGDIHGCLEPLKEYFKDGLKDNEFYIFCGDYIDRGIQNAETLSFLMSIANKPNVLFLEGNHEKWLWIWAHDGTGKSPEFEKNTRRQLEASGINKKDVRKFYRSLIQCAYYTYDGNTYVVTHGGISNLPNTYLSTYQMIHGVGGYKDSDKTDDSFYNNLNMDGIKFFSIHGHRNVSGAPIAVNDCCYNLEGSIEFGGCLRSAVVSHDGISTCEIKNNTFGDFDYGEINKDIPTDDIAEIIAAMRSTCYINEKKMGNISSFNFTREAFLNDKWSDATIKARGLFINTANNEIVARGYEKFFRENERPETKFEMLRHKLVFPVTAYVKENGYLGILGYNAETDTLFIASKSTCEGDYAENFKRIFYENVKDPEWVKSYLRDNNKCMVFEVIDPINDPHIIEYSKRTLVLLDVLDRNIVFNAIPYTELCEISEAIGVKCKTRAVTLNSWEDFYAWHEEIKTDDYKYNGSYIEGFVVEDESGFMFKEKSAYYTVWKFLRGVAESTIRYGHYNRTSALVTPEQNRFYGFVKDLALNNYDGNTDIISLRKVFLEKQT